MNNAARYLIGVGAFMALAIVATLAIGSGGTGGGSSGGIAGPTSSTNSDLAAFSGTGGKTLVDTGIPSANVVLTSRTISAGTGLTVTNSGLLTSDITMSMSTIDNQALTVNGLLTAVTGISTSGTKALTFTGANGSNVIVLPTGGSAALRIKDQDANVYMAFDTTSGGGQLVSIGNACNIGGNTVVTGHLTGGNIHSSNGYFYADGGGAFFTFTKTSISGDYIFQDSNGKPYLSFDTNTSAGGMSLQVPITAASGIIGPTSGAAIAAPYLGEELRCTVTAASGLTMSSGVTLNICSITLTPGVWQVTAVCGLDSSLTGTDFQCGISTTSATMPGASLKGDSWVETPTVSSATADDMITVPSYRVLVTAASGNTLYYMTEQATVSAGTPKGYGRMNAERR